MLKFLMAGLLFLSTSAVAQLAERLDSLMQVTTSSNQPGAALLVIAGNKRVYQKGYGLANVETKVPITPETNFRMASVSKQFTAMGILLLEKDRKLSLNDPLVKFFPGFTAQVAGKVQIRHLLTHTSGILDYESVMNPNQQKQLLDSDVLTLLKDRDSLYFEPGSQFRYSNSAYCLLALIIERVSDQSFASFIQQRIFMPLKMNQSMVYKAGGLIVNRAMGYRKKENGFVFSDQSVTSATKGDGGVYTSLVDYQKWNTALRNGTLLDLKAVLARTGQAIPKSSDSFYGAGWFFRQPDNPILFHSGSTCGFNNYVINIPSKQFLLVYFSNKATNKANAISVVKILANAGYPELTDMLTLDDLTQ
ncbi:serine hydrolase domain-containing protein [Spirosoma validum]|uniref:Beta-lactamase family protein n=1 Tax=Spirosoma validum TaxID=2771355 RepID=A0A927B3B2_9BACT|nr:serine hydrolase domain-containing protein [Spirosoma validum]MBD2754836.1 beta-lactamase family protein [Spirosoma validum]